MRKSEALRYRGVIEQAAQSLDDATASTAPDMFPRLKQDGSLIPAGTRINWHGQLKRAAVDLWDTAENNPDNAPELWETSATGTDTGSFLKPSQLHSHFPRVSVVGGVTHCTAPRWTATCTPRHSIPMVGKLFDSQSKIKQTLS